MSQQQTPATTPERVGRYSLLSPLGEGGMAQVFIAQKDGAEHVCVLKQLHGQLETHAEASRRFHREANIASQLNHPHIAQILDAGVEDGRFCLAMEFIAGQTVEDLVKEARRRGHVLPLEVSIAILLQALDALSYAHDLEGPDGRVLGLVHRDLSPRNVMLDYEGNVKLIDFGIAKGNVDEYKTQVGALMGTPYYMSPEQALAIAVDKRSDLYTIAAVFFEMLAGRRLVKAKGRAKILLGVVQDPVPQVSTLTERLPVAFDALMEKALAKQADERFSSAAEFKAAVIEAAGPLARTTPQVLGSFVRGLFPEGPNKAEAFKALAVAQNEPVEMTRVASMDDPVSPVALSEPGGKDERTRTAFASSGIDTNGDPQLVFPQGGGLGIGPVVDHTGVEMPAPTPTRAAFRGEANLVAPHHTAANTFAPHFDPAESAGYVSASSTHDGYSTINGPQNNWLIKGAMPLLLVMGGAVGWAAYSQFKPAEEVPLADTHKAPKAGATASVRPRAGVRSIPAAATAEVETAPPEETKTPARRPSRRVERTGQRERTAQTERTATDVPKAPPITAPPPAAPPVKSPPPKAAKTPSWASGRHHAALRDLEENPQAADSRAAMGKLILQLRHTAAKMEDGPRKKKIKEDLRRAMGSFDDRGFQIKLLKKTLKR